MAHDPELPLDRTLIPSPPTRPKHPVFDNEDMGKVGDLIQIICLNVFQSSIPTIITSTLMFKSVSVQLLAELLRSKNPEDLQEANRLIKNMVKEVRHVRAPCLTQASRSSSNDAFTVFCQDEARVQKVTKRMHTLEEVNINVRLLTEMLSHYNKDSSSDSDKEIIKVCVRAL